MWIGHVTRQDASISKTALHWTPEGKTREGPPQEHLAVDSRERNFGDGGGLGGRQAHGNRRADVEGARCCPT